MCISSQGGETVICRTFPLDDLRDPLFHRAHHSHTFGEDKYYTALCAVLDPVRHILRSHPTLARIMSRIIGKDDFWIQILGSGNLTSLTDLIGGLMARAYELPNDGFRAAATELNAFLGAAREDKTVAVPGDLDVGYDVVLFHGLSLREKFAIGDDMMIVPFEAGADVRGRESAGEGRTYWHQIQGNYIPVTTNPFSQNNLPRFSLHSPHFYTKQCFRRIRGFRESLRAQF